MGKLSVGQVITLDQNVMQLNFISLNGVIWISFICLIVLCVFTEVFIGLIQNKVHCSSLHVNLCIYCMLYYYEKSIKFMQKHQPSCKKIWAPGNPR